MKKIQAQTEAFNVLVGEIDFLECNYSAFVRLNKPVILDDLTEVNLPSRFIYIMLGPKGNIHVYRQIGRSISTIMSDEVIFNGVLRKLINNPILNQNLI